MLRSTIAVVTVWALLWAPVVGHAAGPKKRGADQAEAAPASAGNASEGSAETKARAKKLFEEGVLQYNLGRYAEAAVKYEDAYRLHPDPALLYNAAQAHRLAGNHAQALALYMSFRRLYPNSPKATEVERFIEMTRQAVADEQAREQKEKEQKEAAEREARARADADAARALSLQTQSESLHKAPEKPLYKRGWFWGVLGGSVALVGLAVGLGVGLGVKPSDPTATFGTLQAN